MIRKQHFQHKCLSVSMSILWAQNNGPRFGHSFGPRFWMSIELPPRASADGRTYKQKLFHGYHVHISAGTVASKPLTYWHHSVVAVGRSRSFRVYAASLPPSLHSLFPIFFSSFHTHRRQGIQRRFLPSMIRGTVCIVLSFFSSEPLGWS